MRTSLLSGLLALGLAACVELRPGDERLDGTAGDGGSDGTVDASCAPELTTLSPTVAAIGGSLVLDGTCLGAVTSATLGGITQTIAMQSDTRIVLAPLAEGTPVQSSVEVVVDAGGATDTLSLPVVRLVVNEVDADTSSPTQDRHQFIEVAIGFEGVADLSGYTVVFVDGADDKTYMGIAGVRLGTTSANGIFLLGNNMVAGAQATFANATLAGNANAHAVLIYQRASLPPSGAFVTSITDPLIDGLVYSTTTVADDPGLLALANPNPADRVQWSETTGNGDPTLQSIRRCAPNARLSGMAFGVGTPTPGAANPCP